MKGIEWPQDGHGPVLTGAVKVAMDFALASSTLSWT